MSGEETYRLLVDEIPADQTSQTTAVRVQLRYSVPVFVGGGSGEQTPALDFSLEPMPVNAGAATASSGASAAGLALRAANLDTRHAQISQVKLDWPDGHTTDVASGLLGYALPRASRRWTIANAPVGATRATLHALINGVPVTRTINLDTPAAQASAEARKP